jgi:hypothetical protein
MKQEHITYNTLIGIIREFKVANDVGLPLTNRGRLDWTQFHETDQGIHVSLGIGLFNLTLMGDPDEEYIVDNKQNRLLILLKGNIILEIELPE